MLREFFLSDDRCTLAVAWLGVLLIVTHSVFLASVRYRVNSFYATFYDLLGSAVSDEGSGSFNTLADERREVWAQLKELVLILLPLMWATPAAKWLKSAWSFRWRTALMKAYLREWNADRESIEGASQRLHEDSQRFSSALQGCLSSLLDAAATLVVFTPALFELGAKVRPPVDLGSLGEAANGWLWLTALLAALVGLGGAAFLGQRLVGIEVANQRVEATLRKDLVLLETNPSAIVGEAPPGSVPWPFFGLVLGRLSENYHALFRHFTLVNAWLAWHDQCLLVLPYFLAAPLLFSADPRESDHVRHAHPGIELLREGLLQLEHRLRQLDFCQRVPQRGRATRRVRGAAIRHRPRGGAAPGAAAAGGRRVLALSRRNLGGRLRRHRRDERPRDRDACVSRGVGGGVRERGWITHVSIF